MDASSLQEWLAAEELPWARFPVPGQGRNERAIEVDVLRALLRQRGVDIDARTLEQLVHALGGRRTAMIDPWSLPASVWAWLRGRGWRSNDLYTPPANSLDARDA
jgi:hypothetical protein